MEIILLPSRWVLYKMAPFCSREISTFFIQKKSKNDPSQKFFGDRFASFYIGIVLKGTFLLQENQHFFYSKKRQKRLLPEVFSRSFCLLLDSFCIKGHLFAERKWALLYLKEKDKTNSYQKFFGDRFASLWIGIVLNGTFLLEKYEHFFWAKKKR